jgi:hypothetical protein
MGGVKRRRGMRKVTGAISSGSRLIPYIYSYEEGEGLRYIVEVNGGVVKVYNGAGEEQASFESGLEGGIKFHFEPDKFRYYQQNRLLFITSLNNAPMVLEYDGVSEWKFDFWKFKHHAWSRYNELQEKELVL